MAAVGREVYSASVSQDDPKDPDPGATIQVDPARALDHVQLVDSTPGPLPTATSRPPSRKTPPPLPPSASMIPVAPLLPVIGEEPPKASRGKTIAIFVVLAAVCAVVGVTVGSWARARRVTAMPATTGTTASASAAASDGVLVLPPVEVQSPQSQ